MSKKFDKLAEKISHEYERKGIPPEKAKEWGRETAGKVYEEQQSRKKGKK